MQLEIYNDTELVENITLDNGQSGILTDQSQSLAYFCVDLANFAGEGMTTYKITGTNVHTYSRMTLPEKPSFLYEMDAPVSVDVSYTSDLDKPEYESVKLDINDEDFMASYTLCFNPDQASEYSSAIETFKETGDPNLGIDIVNSMGNSEHAFIKEWDFSFDIESEENILLGLTFVAFP